MGNRIRVPGARKKHNIGNELYSNRKTCELQMKSGKSKKRDAAALPLSSVTALEPDQPWEPRPGGQNKSPEPQKRPGMNNTKQFKIQNNSKLNRSAESKRKEIGCPLCVFKFCMKTTGWPFSIIMRGKSNHHQVSPHTSQKANQPRSTKNTFWGGHGGEGTFLRHFRQGRSLRATMESRRRFPLKIKVHLPIKPQSHSWASMWKNNN